MVLYGHAVARGAHQLQTSPNSRIESSLSLIVELFEQKSRGNQPFQAGPAPLSRIIEQLDTARTYCVKAPIGFSVPDYMTPLAGTEAERLYESYLRQLGPEAKIVP
jgi:hypothetical protein